MKREWYWVMAYQLTAKEVSMVLGWARYHGRRFIDVEDFASWCVFHYWQACCDFDEVRGDRINRQIFAWWRVKLRKIDYARRQGLRDRFGNVQKTIANEVSEVSLGGLPDLAVWEEKYPYLWEVVEEIVDNEKQMTVLLDRFNNNMPMSEIVKKLGVSEAMGWNYYHKALEKLRERLKIRKISYLERKPIKSESGAIYV